MPEDKDKPEVVKKGQEVGASGTVITSGIITDEEYNKDLEGFKGIDEYEKMRKNDATVRSSMQLVKLPIEALIWSMEPTGDKDREQFIARFIENQIFKSATYSYPDFLRQALLMLDYGF